MSITVRPGQGALSHAWRCGRIRRTARQSKCAEARHLHHAGDRRASAGSSMDPPIAEAAARPQVRCRSRGVSTRYGTHADAKLAFPSFAPASHHNRRQAGADARSASGSACVFPVCSSTSPSNGPRCGARTRGGRPCRSPAVYGKRRCRMHGGAVGSGAPEGNQNALKHGVFTKEAIRRAPRSPCLDRSVTKAAGGVE